MKLSLLRLCLLLPVLWLSSVANADTLQAAREGFKTTLLKQVRSEKPFLTPPEALLKIVQYPGELGPMNAYLGQPAEGLKKSPAIIWITGGFPAGGIGSGAWEPEPKTDDQSAKVFRLNGMVMMYPAFRGNRGNPGYREGFYGEVNDVLSALEYLRSQPFVDPENIYLGGHSTGGALAMLVAAATDKFKTVFAFGPIAAPIYYGEQYALHDPKNKKENHLRAPVMFVDMIQSNTWVIEGEQGNIDSLRQLKKYASRQVSFYEIKGANHFNVLYPLSKLIAGRIMENTSQPFSVSKKELQKAFDQSFKVTNGE